jgi:hypothetical protein
MMLMKLTCSVRNELPGHATTKSKLPSFLKSTIIPKIRNVAQLNCCFVPEKAGTGESGEELRIQSHSNRCHCEEVVAVGLTCMEGGATHDHVPSSPC